MFFLVLINFVTQLIIDLVFSLFLLVFGNEKKTYIEKTDDNRGLSLNETALCFNICREASYHKSTKPLFIFVAVAGHVEYFFYRAALKTFLAASCKGYDSAVENYYFASYLQGT